MAQINKNFGEGGANLTPDGANGVASLADVLRDIADDLGDRSGITSPDASDLGTAITLLNEIKAALNVAVRTTKG